VVGRGAVRFGHILLHSPTSSVSSVYAYVTERY
jgi:hypothetical protein